jgi:NitT/TauT family transport system substrate-binding protein
MNEWQHRQTPMQLWIQAARSNAMPLFGIVTLFLLAFVVGRPPDVPRSGAQRLRLGYFANVTHAPAVLGVGRGTFQQALGRQISLDPKIFNAGPEAMEALLAGEIDVCYVGPGPAINTFLKSNGTKLKIIAGACSGGAVLVARDGVHIANVRDLEGKRVAIPQIGGTQDISLRHFLALQGLRGTEKGGSVPILAVKNADMLTLFKRGELDAAWVPEPWGARLIHDGKASLVLDERDLWPDHKVTTTVVVARRAYLDQHPQEVQKLLAAHLQILTWMRQHAEEAQNGVNSELKRLSGKRLSDVVLREAWGRCDFTADPNPVSIAAIMQAQVEGGYLPRAVNVAQLLDTHLLGQAAPTEYAGLLPPQAKH